MSIQWYPGHMNAAKKKAAEQMENTDLVIEVLDARLPEASCNPMVEELRLFRQRPCLKILNKVDLADPVATAAWSAWYDAQEGVTAYPMTTKKPGDVARIPEICLSLAPHRGVPTKPLRIMIMGIPNVGKSTLMNALLKKKVAKVGDEPAVTKIQQKLYLGKNIILVDTPGMLWPKIALASDGLMLAASHAVGSNALIEEEVAVFLAEVLLEQYPHLLVARYGFNLDGMDPDRRRRRRGRAPRLPHQGRRPGFRKGRPHVPAGLPHRHARPHQPGNPRLARRAPGQTRRRYGGEGAHRRRKSGHQSGQFGARQAGHVSGGWRRPAPGGAAPFTALRSAAKAPAHRLSGKRKYSLAPTTFPHARR